MGSDDHLLVAELEGKVIGMVGVPILKNARQSASIFLGIMVRIESQGQGIGKISMENNLDLADNWLMFVTLV